MREITNMNRKISEMFLNSGNHKEAKDPKNLKTENGNKT